MKTYENYIFDFDGVLVDSKDLSFKAINYALKKVFMQVISRKDFDTKSKIELIRQRNIGPIRSLIILGLARNYFRVHINQTNRCDEFLSMVEKTKQNKLVVSSNSKRNILLSLKERSSIFSKIYGSVGHSNKHKVLKPFAANSLYITDEVRDIEQCQIIGMDVIGVTWGLDSKEELIKAKPLRVISEVSEFDFL